MLAAYKKYVFFWAISTPSDSCFCFCFPFFSVLLFFSGHPLSESEGSSGHWTHPGIRLRLRTVAGGERRGQGWG